MYIKQKSFFVLVDCLNFVFYTVTGTVLYMVIFSKEKLQPELCEPCQTRTGNIYHTELL